jgi:hypothetical protein
MVPGRFWQSSVSSHVSTREFVPPQVIVPEAASPSNTTTTRKGPSERGFLIDESSLQCVPIITPS